MTQISAKIVADSINEQGDRLSTMIITFPRFILAELNTHRMLSKNSASSRAIPFDKMVQSVKEDPFIPIAVQWDHKGMQGNSYFPEREYKAFVASWLNARDYAVRSSEQLYGQGATKQLCNRLLEPFLWHTVLISGTDFSNFFELRCPKYTTPVMGEGFYAKSWKDLIANHSDPDNIAKLESMGTIEKLQHNKGQAEIHMMALAEAMWDAMNESTPKELHPGGWHIPFLDKINQQSLFAGQMMVQSIRHQQAAYLDANIKISTAMCARTSYTVVGDEKEFTYQQQIDLHDKLTTSGHYSPFEHCARVMTDEEYNSFIKGKFDINYADMVSDDYKTIDGASDLNSFGWCLNFRGFIQYRYLLQNSLI